MLYVRDNRHIFWCHCDNLAVTGDNNRALLILFEREHGVVSRHEA